MPVSERLMKPGEWQLALTPDTPKSLLNSLLPFGHIVISGSALDPTAVVDSELRLASRYVGILRTRPTPFEIGGCGLVSWLGDEEGKGDLWESNLVITAKTFVQAVNAALPLGTVTAGTITAIGAGTVTQSFFIADGNGAPRTILDWIMGYFTGEYRVNNDMTVDAGPMATLFPTATTPKAILVPFIAAVDSTLIGITATMLNAAVDADSFSARVWYGAAGGSVGTANASPASTYKNLKGNTAVLTRPVTNIATAAGNANAQAAAEVAKYPLRQQVTLASERYDIRNYLQAGDWAWVYDPENGLHDETNAIDFAGQTVFPTKLRIYALSWPVEAGMGVYYRAGDGTYTDLTRFIAWEQPGVTFEVGAANRPLTF